MKPRRQQPVSILVHFLLGVLSYAALAGGVFCLTWLADRQESVAELQWGPWEGPHGNEPPLVIIDAGHGGHDGGAVANDVVEKNLALKLAERVRFHLEGHGVRTQMTRDDDTFIPLEERSAIANRAQPAAFVSLHLNTSVSAPHVSGIETYYSSRKTPFQQRGLENAATRDPTGERLARSIQFHTCEVTKAVDRGIRERGYSVILHTFCPAVLVECGFLTNTDEAAKFNQAGYRDIVAAGIARGVVEYLHMRQPTLSPLSVAMVPSSETSSIIHETDP